MRSLEKNRVFSAICTEDLVETKIDRNIPPEVLYKKAALKHLIIFTGKHMYWSLNFI